MESQIVFDLAWIGGIIGFFLPLVISFVKRQTWSAQAKRSIALVVAGIAGVVNTGVQAGWVFDGVGSFLSLAAFSIIDVYVAASVIYAHFWEGTAPERKLASVNSS